MTRLKDKIAIVTGGGSGIGRGIALAYAKEGAHVVVADVNLAGAQETIAGVEAAGRRGLAIQTDVASPEQVESMVAAAHKAFGRIDVLVNVAGIIYPVSLMDTTLEQWDRTLDINLRGNFLCMQAVGRIMIEQRKGKIINTTSILGSRARAQRGAYCASKAGIILLTQTAAMELGPLGIAVNAIAPGSIETPMVQSAPSTPEAAAKKAAAIPLQRRGDPEDLTGPAIFLASDDSDYVTGVVLTVDGGMTAGIV
ncbi:SDR family NAD(P)-dependent oxidoreductase [Variovorax saccharolyticus]|uniref:SDR family NAD(P)-dependent oxidoreductase n=1 Tax=Variovorax saccharolyticus TaxID=3053516 RepID=UPI0025791064|nr:SDR family NAD(P)-dependent oxidoreductase [Variovorax sp. J22R187]MDM0021835.1 SDR family NAD(P)-dependent oxidoreductase [Variovorax sp. J22R187]